jgi:hypothetical protein
LAPVWNNFEKDIFIERRNNWIRLSTPREIWGFLIELLLNNKLRNIPFEIQKTGNANGPLGVYLIQNNIYQPINNFFEFNAIQGREDE